MKNQRILIHVENGIVDTVLVEDENQTQEIPDIQIIDVDDQASDPVNEPPAHVRPVTTKTFNRYIMDIKIKHHTGDVPLIHRSVPARYKVTGIHTVTGDGYEWKWNSDLQGYVRGEAI